MRTDNKVAMFTAMQLAFVDGLSRVMDTTGVFPGKLAATVGASINRQKPRTVRGWDAKVSFRAAQKLKQQGVLE